jgi:hypothetical protein
MQQDGRRFPVERAVALGIALGIMLLPAEIMDDVVRVLTVFAVLHSTLARPSGSRKQ